MPVYLARLILSFLLLSAGLAFAQDRSSCAVMKGLDLKPLLGADHDAPVPFGTESCRAESKSPGKIVVLAVMQGTAAELQSMLVNIRKLNETMRAKEVTVVSEPSLGPGALSIRDKDMRQIDIRAVKGSRAISLQGDIGKPFDDAGVKQLVGLAKAVLDKLP